MLVKLLINLPVKLLTSLLVKLLTRLLFTVLINRSLVVATFPTLGVSSRTLNSVV